VKPWVSTPKPIKPRPVFVSLRRGKPGRKKFPPVNFCRPHPGLELFERPTHGFTAGYFRSSLRDLAAIFTGVAAKELPGTLKLKNQSTRI
jgi:hypothetical protein